MTRRAAARRERRGGDDSSSSGGPNRYQMREKMVSIGDDYWIENSAGQKTYKVDGKALRVRDTLKFEDRHGKTLCQIQEKKLRVKDSMKVEDANGQQLAMVKKAIISPVRDRFTVKIGNGPDLEVKGNIVDHEYKIGDGSSRVAEASKKWFRIRDSYGVEIAPGQNDIVILAITVCIDQMAH